MTTDREPMEWAHLKKYGYAPGDYIARCHRCQQSASDLDKRAITCRPCAEEMDRRAAASIGQQMEK